MYVGDIIGRGTKLHFPTLSQEKNLGTRVKVITKEQEHFLPEPAELRAMNNYYSLCQSVN